MKTPQLYLGSVNNHVHTVLTEAAVKALIAQRDLVANGGAYSDRGEVYLAIAAAGTFTFVRPDDYPNYEGYATGTLEDLTAWTNGTLPSSPISNYVPFSNGARHEDRRFVRTPREAVNAFGLVRPTV